MVINQFDYAQGNMSFGKPLIDWKRISILNISKIKIISKQRKDKNSKVKTQAKFKWFGDWITPNPLFYSSLGIPLRT